MKMLTILSIFLLGYSVNAQEIKTELNELSTPSNPAFTILGLSPSEINRPTLLKPFAINLANGIGAGGSLASDIAIEASPYWWWPHPDLTYSDYYGFGKNGYQRMTDIMKSSFAFSLATSDASPDIDSIDSRYLALGGRLQLLNGKPSQEMQKTYFNRQHQGRRKLVMRSVLRKIDQQNDVATLKATIDAEVTNIINTNAELSSLSASEKATIISEMKTAFKDQVDASLSSTATKEEIKSFVEKLSAEITDEILVSLKEINGMSRVGWLWEVATAVSWHLPDNRVNNVEANEYGIWTNLTYRMDAEEGKAFHDFIAMARLTGNTELKETYNIDLGLSWAISNDNYMFSLEAIFRQYRTDIVITATNGQTYPVTEKDNTGRFALAFQYKLSDNINLTASAGKDYDNALQTGGNLFTLINAVVSIPTAQKLKL